MVLNFKARFHSVGFVHKGCSFSGFYGNILKRKHVITCTTLVQFFFVRLPFEYHFSYDICLGVGVFRKLKIK